MPVDVPEWRGERYCLGCRMVSPGVGEDGFCPDCIAAWERKHIIDAQEVEMVIAKAKLAMPGVSERQIRRMMKRGRFVT
jgi:hypothetical protein